MLEECTSKKSNSECYVFWICWADLWKCARANLEGANLEGADLEGADLGRDGIEPPTRGFSVLRSMVKLLFLNS